jgi:formylglycine-generating enzyme required for sulfatase activity
MQKVMSAAAAAVALFAAPALAQGGIGEPLGSLVFQDEDAPPDPTVRRIQAALNQMDYAAGPEDGRRRYETYAVAVLEWEGPMYRQRDAYPEYRDYFAMGRRTDAEYLSQLANAVERSRASGHRKQLRPGETFRNCDACPEMVAIPEGSFVMGSPAGEEGRDPDEGPQHTVSVRAFALGVYEVTYAEFEAFIRATGHMIEPGCTSFDGANWTGSRVNTVTWRNPGYPVDARSPVTCVSWSDARTYTLWLSEVTGHYYRLPTEAEWEYAVRAGTTGRYWWGDPEPSCSGGVNDANFEPCARGGAVPVGSFRPNQRGLYDMHGNVAEWVEDTYSAGYAQAPTDGAANLLDYADRGQDTGLTRGGAWRYEARRLRSAYRGGANRIFRTSYYGFRVARN